MKNYRNYLRNTLLMTVLTVGLFFVLPQSRVLADEVTDENKQEDVSINVNNQTDGMPVETGLPVTTVNPEVTTETNSTTEEVEPNSEETQQGGSEGTLESQNAETSNSQIGTGTESEGVQVLPPTGSDAGNETNAEQQLEQTASPTAQTTIPAETNESETIEPTVTEGSESGGEEGTETPVTDSSKTPAETEITPVEASEQPDELLTQSLSEESVKKASISAIPASVSNEEKVDEAVSEKIADNTYIEGVTYMSSRVYDYDMPVKFRYSDTYFTGDSTAYNLDLATLSAVAAGTTSGSNRAKGYIYNPAEEGQYEVIEDVEMAERFMNQSKNVQEFLRQIGFSNVQVNDAYLEMGTPVSAGVAIGKKEITDSTGKKYTLISILPRSTSYFGEWANSMNIGGDDTRDYAGLESAVNDYVLKFLEEYITENEIKGDLKIWTAGLSRGGGLANFTAAYLDKELENGATNQLFGIEGVNLSANDIYAYTFGAPTAASLYNAAYQNEEQEWIYDPLYHNIHNFVASYDMVVGALNGKWPTTRYGADQDYIVDTKEAWDNIQDLLKFYAAVNNKEIDNLTSADYMYADEEGNPHYFPIEYSANYQGEEMNLEEFIKAYMSNLTEAFSREAFADEIQTGLMFFGETYYGYPSEIKKKLTKDALLDTAKAKGTEVAMEAVFDLFTGNFEALKELLKYVLNPAKILPDVVLDTFDNIGMVPKWNLEKLEEFTPEQVESGEARELNREYLIDLVKAVFKIGIHDPVGLYNLYRSYGSLWASHELDVDLSWLHIKDTEENQKYYLKPVTEGEAWGYRMVTLPQSKDMTILIYESDGKTGKFDFKNLRGAVLSDRFYHSDVNPDYYIRMNLDSEGNRILFLRADKEYTLMFKPLVATTTTDGMQLIEYEFMGNRFVYYPEIILDTDDYGVGLGNNELYIIDNDSGLLLTDRLLYNIGKIPLGETTENRIFLMSNETADKPEHNAEYYTLTKMIQIGAQASIGGAVKDRIQNLYFESANSSEVKTATLVATSAAGYRFLGWYLNGELISTDASITRSYKFLSHSELLTARFELIPVPPKPDPKPDPKPAPSDGGSGSSAIVEVAAVTNGQITPAVNNIRRNKTPNTGDTNNAIWMFWMMLGLAGAAGSVYMLKED